MHWPPDLRSQRNDMNPNNVTYPPIVNREFNPVRYTDSVNDLPVSYRTLSSHLEAEVDEGNANTKRSRAVRG